MKDNIIMKSGNRMRSEKMNDKSKSKNRKVPEMRIVVEHIHVFKDTEERIYMSVLPKRTGRAKENAENKTYRFLWIICTLLLSVGMMAAVYLLLAPVAYAERGYIAYGGECVVAVAAGLLTLLVLKGD